MPMQEYGAYQAPSKKKMIKKRPEDMGRGKTKKTTTKSVSYASSKRQEDMGRTRRVGTGTGTGRGIGASQTNANRSSSAKGGMSAPKKKASPRGSKY